MSKLRLRASIKQEKRQRIISFLVGLATGLFALALCAVLMQLMLNETIKSMETYHNRYEIEVTK